MAKKRLQDGLVLDLTKNTPDKIAIENVFEQAGEFKKQISIKVEAEQKKLVCLTNLGKNKKKFVNNLELIIYLAPKA